MKTRAAEVILCAGLIAGATTACSEQPNIPVVPHVPENVHGDLRYAGSQLLKVALANPKHTEGKPPYTISASEPLAQGARVTYAIQTATKAHRPSDIESIELSQEGVGVANFDLRFLLQRDGTWNVYCEEKEDGLSGPDTLSTPFSLSEIGENTVEYDGKTVDGYGPAEAKAILSDHVQNLSMVAADLQWQPSTELQALPDPCHINLG